MRMRGEKLSNNEQQVYTNKMSAKRIELLTNGLKGHCSTIELRAHTDTYFNMPLYPRQQALIDG